MRIQVRKCPFTGKIFEEKDLSKYILHLAKLRDQKREEREGQRIKTTFQSWLEKEREEITSFEDIIPWILLNQTKLAQAYNAMYYTGPKGWNDKFETKKRIVDLEFNCKFATQASNSHCHPKGGVTNWCAKDRDKPSSYPGWSGHLSGKLDTVDYHGKSPSWSTFFKMIDIHTGTGSGGVRFQYGVTIFLSDWPGLSHGLVVKKLTTGSIV